MRTNAGRKEVHGILRIILSIGVAADHRTVPTTLSDQVVRVQYHPGAPNDAGGWLVGPELKMEFIGRMSTEEEESDGANDGVAQKDAVVAS